MSPPFSFGEVSDQRFDVVRAGLDSDRADLQTFEGFLDVVDNHPRANMRYDPSHFILQQRDYLQFIDIYHERIKALHEQDA